MPAYKSPLIQAMHYKIMSDNAARNTLKEALGRVMLTDTKISLMHAKTLQNIILDYYHLPQNTFADVNLTDFVALGKIIISIHCDEIKHV